MNGEPGFPCQLCGVRSDVACRHRPAEAPRQPQAIKEDLRKDASRYANAHGLNFHRARKNNNSLAYWHQQKAKKAGRPKLPKGRG